MAEDEEELFKRGGVVQRPTIQLIITLYPDGSANISGPINDKILSYGLLELAKSLVANYKPKEEKIIASSEGKIIE